jgi:hypothetical protein
MLCLFRDEVAVSLKGSDSDLSQAYALNIAYHMQARCFNERRMS